MTSSKTWFLGGGIVGVLIAAIIGSIRPTSLLIILLFWPFSIVGIADPRTLGDKVFFYVFAFGGNFLFYGMLALWVRIQIGKRRALP